MQIKQYKGKVFGANLTAKERLALQIEVQKCLEEAEIERGNDFDAMILWTLHTEFGFGKTRLRKFYDAFRVEHNRLMEHYKLPQDGGWIAQRKLKEIDVDVAAWNSESRGKDA